MPFENKSSPVSAGNYQQNSDSAAPNAAARAQDGFSGAHKGAICKNAGRVKIRGIAASLFAFLSVSACAPQSNVQLQPAGLSAPKKTMGQTRGQNVYRQGVYKQGRQRQPLYGKVAYTDKLTERRCLERAMFFESNRSSRDGLVAVGTVVMNRVHSSQYPNTICAVVGQKNQFAPGVLTRSINMDLVPDIAAAADSVLRGERSEKLKNAMYFHTAGLNFPYTNMHYVLVAGGNSFYEKRRRDGSLSNAVHDTSYDVAYAYAQERGDAAPALAALDGAVAENFAWEEERADTGKILPLQTPDSQNDMQAASAAVNPADEELRRSGRKSGAGAAESGKDNIQLASVTHSSARDMRAAGILGRHGKGAAVPSGSVADAANASLRSIYDRGDEAREDKSAAVSAVYDSADVSVPVPYLKANFNAEAMMSREGFGANGGAVKMKSASAAGRSARSAGNEFSAAASYKTAAHSGAFMERQNFIGQAGRSDAAYGEVAETASEGNIGRFVSYKAPEEQKINTVGSALLQGKPRP